MEIKRGLLGEYLIFNEKNVCVFICKSLKDAIEKVKEF